MAEKLKEFANVTLTGADFTSSEYTILSNTSTTQAVIKDMSIEVTAPMVNSNVAVINGVSTVANGGSSTGFELVAEDSSLKIKLNPAMVGGTFKPYSLTFLENNSSYKKATFGTNTGVSYLPNGLTAELVIDATATAVTTMSQPSWFHINAAGNYAYYFYYDTNSTTKFYYAPRDTSTGVIGSWIGWNTGSYQYAALDASADKVYIHTDYYGIKIFDLATRSVVTKSSAFHGVTTVTPTSYAHSAAVNGIFFSQPSNSYTNSILYYNVATDTNGTISGSVHAGSSGCTSVSYNPDEERYYILTKQGTNTRLGYIDGNSLTGGYSITQAGTGVIDIPTTSCFIGSTADGYFAWQDDNGDVRLGKAADGTITKQDTYIKGTLYSYNGPSIRAGTTLVIGLSGLGVELKVKVSGVEITGV